MNSTDILEKKWYRKSQTLGEGGWSKIYSSGIDWKTYVLYEKTAEDGNFQEVETIIASDDATAMGAFESLYHMERFLYWEVQEKIVEYRMVSMKTEE